MVSLWVTLCGKCHKPAAQAIAFRSMGQTNSPLEFAHIPHLGSLFGTVCGPWTRAHLEITSGGPGQGPSKWYHYGLLFVENATSWPPKLSPLSQWATGIHPWSLCRYHILGSQFGTVHGPWTCAHLKTTSGGPMQRPGKWYHYGLHFVENATSWRPKQSPLSQWATRIYPRSLRKHDAQPFKMQG